MKYSLTILALSAFLGLGMCVDSIDLTRPGWLVFNQADAHSYGTSRRVARRTARRTSRRH